MKVSIGPYKSLVQSFHEAHQRNIGNYFIPRFTQNNNAEEEPSVVGDADGAWNLVQFQNLAPLDTSTNGGLSGYSVVPDIHQQKDDFQTSGPLGLEHPETLRDEKLSKPQRKRDGLTKVWRPNPSFSQFDQDGLIEAAATHGMSVGSFIVALCRAYVEANPIILRQNLRPSMPPMTSAEHRDFVGLCTNLNQVARVMNEGRKIAIEHDAAYPQPPNELVPTLLRLYNLLRVDQ